MNQWWPLSSLRLTTPQLELRFPSNDDLAALGVLAADGVHDPAEMPFMVPWTDAEPPERARSTMQWQWTSWGSWQPDNWRLGLVVVESGSVVGIQEMNSTSFSVRREVATGSWLGRRHQGRGIGTQMRAAVLHFAFECLGAESAVSGAFVDNAASLAVSRKLGYADDGLEVVERRGQRAVQQRLRLDRQVWEQSERIAVTVEGFDGCRAMFGI